MERRQFIRIMGGATALSLLPACQQADDGGVALPQHDYDDIRLQLLSYAVLAANPHNIQPWLVALTGPLSMALYVDQQRLLPDTDPPARQVHIAQGTFLENLSLAARQFGYRDTLDYFPRGMYHNTTVENLPVAAINLEQVSDLLPPDLFPRIASRCSNKRVYSNRPIPVSALEALQQLMAPEEMQLHIETDPQRVSRIAEFCAQAMAIENQDRSRELETIHMFRFNNKEALQYRDGLTVAQTGKTGLSKWLVETLFISRERAEQDPDHFSAQGTQLAREQAQSAQAFAWLSTTRNQRLDQVLCGRFYQRLHLTTTALDIALHPMSQVLQEYADMAALQQSFYHYLQVPEGHTVQMLVRLGLAEPVPHTLRRDVTALLHPQEKPSPHGDTNLS